MGDKTQNNKTDGVAIDVSSPFYLHPSDYTRQMHVNDLLSDNNYVDWEQEMENFLFAKNKIGFVDGTIKKPESGSSDYMAWRRCDAMLKGWLTTAMEKDIHGSVKYATTASEIWAGLKERFGKQTAPRAYELKQALTNTRQDGASVCAYYTKLRVIWDEIQTILPSQHCTCNGCSCNLGKQLEDLRNKERLYEFLMGLDGEFSVIKTQIMALNPSPTLTAAFQLVSQDEQQRMISTGKRTTVESAAFQTQMRRAGNTNSQNKMTAKAGKRVTNDRVEHCDFCNKDGHNRKGCFKLVGYPEWWLGKGKSETPKAKAALVESEESPIPGLNNEQYQQFLNMFTEKNAPGKEEVQPTTNMAGLELEEIDWSGLENVTSQTENSGLEEVIIQTELPAHIENEGPTRERRERVRSKRLDGYEVNLPPSIDHALPNSTQNSSTVHPIANYISYNKFSNNHKAFLTAISANDDPKTFHQAVQDKNWRDAMKKEIEALESNETWTLEDLPLGKRSIDSKWVYKVKYKPNGDIERYKARLVAKGFTQMEGIDFHDTFAPVAKLVTVCTLLAVAVKRNWVIHQLDVNNAFLHGDLNEEVYMKVPQGFDKGKEKKVCRLRKSLYGLKQASRNWYQKFTSALLEMGFRQCKADHSLFIFNTKETFIAALIYVDDVIVVGNDVTKIKETKIFLNKRFSIKDLGPLKYFLGIEVTRTQDGLALSQRKYTLDILEDSGMLGCRPSAFPMEQNLKLGKRDEGEYVDASQCRRLIGRLLYMQATRPDIAHSVNVLSQFVSDPRQSHMDAATRV
ncbi:uncharacterized protein LOC143546021 [Bidens hawaiensis]|uniref:uncharacterized protein LOC143546021 n=1 Tax=Bidens hawaiensis TaxID=980011 RepID=UPI0040499F6A